jgi:serine protease Do
MAEQKPSSMSVAVTMALVSAAIGTVFGFIGGSLGADQQLRDSVLASLSPSLARHAKPAATTAPEAPAAAPEASDEQRVVDAVQRVSPAVVSIVISKDVPTYEEYQVDPFQGQQNQFFDQFFGNGMPHMMVPQYRQNGTEKQDVGAGSGFIVSPDGYIVTNKHVVADTQADYTVILTDKRKFDAKVLARDPVNDIAVLKIEATGLPTVPFADSGDLKVGQRVIAIGYALGQFSNTVSTGVVSGLQRSIEAGDAATGGSEQLYDVIQTDAAINPGNSGGPLLDSKGRAIGMNVAMVQGSQSIGFALPINDVKKAYETVKGGGKIAAGAFLGVRYVMITKELKAKNQLPVDQGALVVRGQGDNELAVMPSSPADIAGIVENDIILEVNGQKLTEDFPLTAAVRHAQPGDKLQIKLLRKGKEMTVEVTLKERQQ